MLFLGVSLSFLICSTASSVAQPLAQFQQAVNFDDYKVEFFKTLYSTVDTLMVAGLHADFKHQIASGCRDSVSLDSLLQQLPFEPDNLRTGDCTFNACCNVLMLDEYRKTSNSELLELLGHVAVLTYFRHSVAFFTDVFKPALETCANKIVARLPVMTARNYYGEFSNSESSNFTDYKRRVLERMASYITKIQIPVPTPSRSTTAAAASAVSASVPWSLKITVVEDDGSLKVVYKKARSRIKGTGEELEDFTGAGGIKLLVSEVLKRLGHIVKITRQFNGNLGFSGIEPGKTCRYPFQASYPDVDIQYTVPPLSTGGPVSVVPSSLTCTIQTNPELYMPTLVLQVPTTCIDDPVDEYLTDPEKITHSVQVHQDLGLQEKATRHAIVASFSVAATQNTWFSGSRGLRPTPTPTPQTQQISNWIASTQANFEMYYQLLRKN